MAYVICDGDKKKEKGMQYDTEEGGEILGRRNRLVDEMR